MKSFPPLPSLLLIPTGIGCEIGGYAGDAIPFARLLAAASGCLITHPNVMNGASLYWNDERIQYVEGYGIDRFVCDEFLLRPVRKQKVGILLDAGLETDLRQRHLQVVDGCRAALGLDLGPVVTTDSPLEISFSSFSTGASWGELINLDPLLSAGDRLKENGATAIAVVTRFPDDLASKDLDAYRQGKGVDLLAGAEAVISHALVRHLCIPCAHAPALSPLPMEPLLDPRAAGEEIGYTFFPSVLVGLSRAPDLISKMLLPRMSNICQTGLIGIQDLGAVVVPKGALGGEAILGCIERNIPLIVVSNSGVLKVDLESLGLKGQLKEIISPRIFSVNNYLEAAGLLISLREGLAIDSLHRPINKVQDIK